MKKPCVVLTPLSQITVKECIEGDIVAPLLKDGLLFTKIEPDLRRALLDTAKSADASEDVLEVLLESDLIFWASVPKSVPSILENANLQLTAALYSLIADAILNRIYNCLMIFNLHPPRLPRGCWFYATGSPGQVELATTTILDPHWEPTRIPSYEPNNPPFRVADMSIKTLGLLWDRLSPLLKIDKLKSAFCREAKWSGYLDAAEAFAKRKAEDLAAIRSEESGELVEARMEGEIYDDWWLEGAINAFGQAVRKLDFDLEQGSRGRRLIQAVQFLSHSAMLPYPFRFVTVITCFESLFSKEPAEVSHQLAARTAWFLHPNDPSKRVETYNDVISIYKVRSDFVHGRTYNISNKMDQITKSEFIIRQVLIAMLSNDKLLSLIFDKNPILYDRYLSGLSLGQTETDETTTKQ